ILIGVAAYLLYTLIYLYLPHGEPQRFFAVVFYATASYLLFYCFICFCMHFFARENKIISGLADASYWIYLIQVPVIIYVQHYIVYFIQEIYLQFMMICLLSFLV